MNPYIDVSENEKECKEFSIHKLSGDQLNLLLACVSAFANSGEDDEIKAKVKPLSNYLTSSYEKIPFQERFSHGDIKKRGIEISKQALKTMKKN